MGLLGGDSESKSTSVANTTNTDKRQVVDNQSVGITPDIYLVQGKKSNSDLTLNSYATVTDFGAIDAAMNAFSIGNDTIRGSLSEVLGLADSALRTVNAAGARESASVDSALAGLTAAYETAQTTEAGGIDQKTLIVLAIAGAVVAVFIFGKRKA